MMCTEEIIDLEKSIFTIDFGLDDSLFVPYIFAYLERGFI